MVLKPALLFALFLLAYLITSAQTKNNFTDNWKKVEAFEKKGLNASALAETRKIFSLAIAAGDEIQQVKAAMYEMKYRNLVEEDNAEKNILYLDTLIAKTKVPAKNILQSMQAELFESYRQQNRYKLYDRTKLSGGSGNDIASWSVAQLNSKTKESYKSSLLNEAVLKSTSLNDFGAILQKGDNSRQLRPTLYDLLVHRALGYFKNTENDITQPSYKFILNDERIFSPAAEFIAARFKTKDSGSLYYNALLLFQDILRFHLNDADPAALIDADLERLAFANEHGIFTNKDSLYEAALMKVQQKNNTGSIAQAMYLRAALYKSQGEKSGPFTNSKNQFKIRLAKELCDSAISRFPGSEGAINAINLKMEIEIPSLGLETEKVNVPALPFRSLVKYKNLQNIYLRVVKTSRRELQEIENKGYDQLWQALVKLRPVKNQIVALPDLHDYREHSAEIKTDGLPSGAYLILASAKADFAPGNNYLARQFIYVSNISYISKNNNEIYVLNRDNGQPLEKAEVQLWQQSYNYTSRNYEEVKSLKISTDNNGFIKLPNDKKTNNNFFLQIKYKGDELYTDDAVYTYYNEDNHSQAVKQTFLFTDRSIYRPGQTVFFKGIATSADTIGKSRILPGYKTKIILTDVNHQKKGSVEVIANDYGSFNGSFKLPETGLTGVFLLRDSVNESVQVITVEEYKRPAFFVEVNKPAGTSRVNDSIHITGIAKAYAGNNISNANVTYRVVRKMQYPFWWYGQSYRKIWPPYVNREQMEITNGRAITNNNGEFSFDFKAIPDETAEKTSQPVFDYEISADITDINGETRSAHTTIQVAYQSLKLDIISATPVNADSLKTISISSSNMNGGFEKVMVNLVVQKLKTPGIIRRERYWDKPDQFVMTKEDFYTNFPYDPYADENETEKWEVEQTVVNINDTTSANYNFKLPSSPLEAGWYKVIATTKDKYGEPVKAEKYILLTRVAQQGTNDPVLINVQKENAEPGEKINYSIATGFEKIWLIHWISRIAGADEIIYPGIRKDAAFKKAINVSEADRGGINVEYAFVQHNRFYSGVKSIAVPWSDKDLDISYGTFRDKILPGSTEQWKIKISGNRKEKVAAEALVSMYDASLDQFKPHSWSSMQSIWPMNSKYLNWNQNTFSAVSSEAHNMIETKNVAFLKSYDELLDAGWNDNSYNVYDAVAAPMATRAMNVNVQQGLSGRVSGLNADENKSMAEKSPALLLRGAKKEDKETAGSDTINNRPENNAVQLRKNLKETAFFFPDLKTDPDGNIEFSFTVPEALTTWKIMTLAHTKDLASAVIQKSVLTQKPLMVQPGMPRFLREGDRIDLPAKIVNLSDSEITGTAQLELFNALTNQPVDGWFKNIFPLQYFTVSKGESEVIKFPLEIPFNFNSALTYRIKAISKNNVFSDGEEAVLPVLTNRMLVTETMPLNVRKVQTKNFKFEKLLKSGSSGSLTNHSLTVEYSSNPAWYAVLALPYLIEYPYECSEQSFNRYYANTLASFIGNSTPKIKAVFEKWLESSSAAPLQMGESNQELKSALLQETPWVLEARNEAEQQKNIAILFDIVRLSKEKESTLSMLKEMQTANGGFSWFKGGRDDRYITQYIITGIGHLRKLNALSDDDYSRLKSILEKALPYLDAALNDEYDNLKKNKADLKANNLSYTAVQYLYMRSFFSANKIAGKNIITVDYFMQQAKRFWTTQNKYMQGMIALALYRQGDSKTAEAILSSLRENALYSEEMGMYFKEFLNSGYHWQEAPIESQSLLIEAFSEISKDNAVVDDLKTWLLKQKQTQNWKTTKATAEACYALLLTGNNWLNEEKEITISLGNTTLKSSAENSQAGSGYFRKAIDGEKVQQGMGNITVNIKAPANLPPASQNGTTWGAVYWQYFEDLDKITPAETPLKLIKKLFIEKNSDTGPVLMPVKDGDEFHIGDKIKVRIELRVDRNMEYIHMKDMRSACMEPVNVLSTYKWQGGLGYYESTKDASTNFFFDWLPRGSYVFEYPVFITHSGDFSNGITTIQSMYAPEFSSHSEGVRISVEEKN